MTKRQPPDSVHVRDVIDKSVRRAAAERSGRSASAARAARVVAAAAGRADDTPYIDYLTALSEMTGRTADEQRRGVLRMAGLLDLPGLHDDAREALSDFVGTPAPHGRVSAAALTLARECLALPLQPVTVEPRSESGVPAASAAGTPAGAGDRLVAGAVRREPRWSLVAVGGSASVALSAVAVAVMLHVVVDRVWLPALHTGRSSTSAAAAAALAGVVVFGLRAGGIFAARIGGVALHQRLQDDDQRHLVDRYAEAPVDWHHRRRPDDLVATAHRAVEQRWRPAAPLPMAIGGVGTLLLAVGGLAWLDPWLAVVGLVVLASLAALSLAFLYAAGPQADRARQLRQEVFELADRAAAPATGGDVGAPRPDGLALFGSTSAELRDVMIGLRRMRSLFVPVFWALPALGMLVAVWIGGTGLDGDDGVADLISTVFLGTLLTAPVLAIGSLLAEVPARRRGHDGVRHVYAEPILVTIGAAGNRVVCDDVPVGSMTTFGRAVGGSDRELDRVADVSTAVTRGRRGDRSTPGRLAWAGRSATGAATTRGVR